MIKFRCIVCSKKIGVPDDYVGKKVKCPQCKTANEVPQDNSFSEQSVDLFALENDDVTAENIESSHKRVSKKIDTKNQGYQQSESYSGLPLWLKYFFGIVALVFISFLLWAFVLRDTWEIDNYSELSSLISDSDYFYYVKDYEVGIKKYDELCELVGDRVLKKKDFYDDFASLVEIYESLKIEMQEEKERLAKIATENKRQAEEEWQRRVAEEARMANPPFVNVKNCKRFFSNIKENDICQFIMLKKNQGSTTKTVRGDGYNIYGIRTRYFENIRIWVNGKSESSWDDFHISSHFSNYIKYLPNENNEFKVLLFLYGTEGASKNSTISMLLDLPISKKGLLDMMSPKHGETTIIKCKIGKRTVLSKEIWDEIKPFNIGIPIGSLHLEATAYSINKIDFENPLAKSLWTELVAIRNNDKAHRKQIIQQAEADKFAEAETERRIKMHSERQPRGRRQTARRSSKTITCPGCGGTGLGKTRGFEGFEELVTIGDSRCPVCMGSGRVSQDRAMEYRRAIRW